MRLCTEYVCTSQKTSEYIYAEDLFCARHAQLEEHSPHASSTDNEECLLSNTPTQVLESFSCFAVTEQHCPVLKNMLI